MRLHPLRRRLESLRRRRRLVRLGAAWSALGLVVAAALFAVFLADWLFDMDRAQRAVPLLLALGAVSWAVARFIVPAYRARDDVLELALHVEREHGIRSDLIAALEFEDARAREWGSPELEAAVIERAAGLADRLDVFRGFTSAPLGRWGAGFLASAAILGSLALSSPEHARAFLDRLLLGESRYPTRTVIEAAFVNGVRIDVQRPGGAAVRCAWGSALSFEARARGELPAKGRALLQGIEGGERSVDLAPASDREGVYRGELPRVTEGAACTIRLGDARLGPLRIEVLPLPAVAVRLGARPPPYARREGDDRPATGIRRIAVLEGSGVDLEVEALTKPLRRVALAIGGEEWNLEPPERGGNAWRLPPAGTPFERVVEPLEFDVRVEDEDGLSPAEKIAGAVRVEPDRPPRIAAAAVTRHVLPGARPAVTFGAADDYGIARIRFHLEVVPMPDGREGGRCAKVIAAAIPEGDRTLVRGRQVLDLAALDLRKGDRVEVTAEAIDDRGAAEGRSALSEPLRLEVTDARGILAAMAESDERSARTLDTIIERQLGIGGSP